jgi:hypothetical protein
MCGIDTLDYPPPEAATPLGLGEFISRVTQVSFPLRGATLGFIAQSRWDGRTIGESQRDSGCSKIWNMSNCFNSGQRVVDHFVGIDELIKTGSGAHGIPTGFCPPAQGCEERATLGNRRTRISTPTGLRQFA